MSELEEIERDLQEYLKKEPNLRRDDRLAYLMTIYRKRVELGNLDHVINYVDYFNIFNKAKQYYVNLKTPVRISRKELLSNEHVHIATLEVFIWYLNKNNLLKKLVKFDFTE